MANNKPIHTVHNPKGGWDNKQDGKILNHSTTKKEAIHNGKKNAIKDNVEHKIHNLDGKISQSNSYGNDPFPPKDKK